MLVLRRNAGEQLVIAGNIRITILQIRGEQVKLGIEAPADISILRAELVHAGGRQPDPAAPRLSEER